MVVNAFGTLILGVIAYGIGLFVYGKSKLLQDLNIPVPVVGGLICTLLFSALKFLGILELHFDQFFFEFFMSMFFCSTGFFIALNSKKQVSNIFKIVACMAVFIVCQNLIALGVTNFFDKPLVYSVCIGSVPMIGGFGSVGVFGSIAEEMGAANGVLSGMIMAVLGLIFGGIIGAPLSLYLYKRYRVTATDEAKIALEDSGEASSRISAKNMVWALALLLLCMYIGYWCKGLLLAYGIRVPLYAGGIAIAILINNVALHFKKDLLKREIKIYSDIALNVFLSISLMILDLTIIGKIAAPVIVCMALQVAFICSFSCMLLRFWEKTYLNILFIAGFLGFGLGALPTGMANVNAIIKKYGHNNQIYLLLPLVSSACDCINGGLIVFLVNCFK